MSNQELIQSGQHSKSVFYQWLKGPTERKKREVTLIPEEVAMNAIAVIINYPHFGGVKGQAYMIYHRQGYIPQHTYQSLKKTVSRIVFQEVSAQNLLPKPSVYEHERPQDINEIWAEDFTEVNVLGFSYPVAFVTDVFSTKYLGYSAQQRESSDLVEDPVVMAVAENNNAGPKEFMLSDHGSQYVSNAHGELLAKNEIVQKHIPACKPQYNGSIECVMRDFKSIFYNVFSQNDLSEFAAITLDATDKKKKLLETVRSSVNKSIEILNEQIPRPSLAGATPNDVDTGNTVIGDLN